MSQEQKVIRGQELAQVVRTARHRAYWCERHHMAKQPHCPDCIVEAVFGFEMRSLASIMA